MSQHNGMKIPIHTTASRDALVNPQTPLLIFNTTTAQLEFYDGSWAALGGGGGGGLNNVSEDLSPELGGFLFVTGFGLSSTGDFPIVTGNAPGEDFSINSNAVVVEGDTNNMGLGTSTPDPAAILDLVSTAKAFRPPQMTAVQRDAIPSPKFGFIVANSTSATIDFFNGVTWEALAIGAAAFLVTDTFTDSDETLLSAHTLDTSEAWIKHTSSTGAGDVVVRTNQAVADANGGNIIYTAAATPPDADYSVQATFSYPNAGVTQGPLPSIIGRAETGTETFYMVEVSIFFGSPTWTLYRVNAGVQTSLGTFAGDNPISSARVVTLEMIGGTIRVLIDDVERINVSNTSITAAGVPGIRINNLAGPQADALDDFSAFK